MAGKSAAASDKAVGNGFQKAIVSMVRFSSAFALYGIDTLQTAVSLRENAGFPKAKDELRSILDSMSESLTQHISRSNRETVETAAKTADKFCQRSVDRLGFADPRRLVRLANDLLHRSSEIVSGSSGRAAPREEEPELAVDILSSPI